MEFEGRSLLCKITDFPLGGDKLFDATIEDGDWFMDGESNTVDGVAGLELLINRFIGKLFNDGRTSSASFLLMILSAPEPYKN